MKPKLFIFALLALLVASCTDEIDIPEPAGKRGKSAKSGRNGYHRGLDPAGDPRGI